nr:hypothetical protein Iba_chr01cCG4190 [Ipomoea batatas]
MRFLSFASPIKVTKLEIKPTHRQTRLSHLNLVSACQQKAELASTIPIASNLPRHKRLSSTVQSLEQLLVLAIS